MKQFLQLLLVVSTGVFIGTLLALHQALSNLERTLDAFDETLDQVEYAIESSYDEAIEGSLPHAPKEYTRWQLRGNAQAAAQAAMDKLTEKHKLPKYTLPTLRWEGILTNPTAAGEARNCYINGRGTAKHFPYKGQITLNEILFLRNYEHFIYIIIPHEVAHVFTCLQGGFVYDDDETDWQAEHGTEWEQAMKDLGFVDPVKFKHHELDLHPVMDYGDTLIERIGTAIGEENVSKE